MIVAVLAHHVFCRRVACTGKQEASVGYFCAEMLDLATNVYWK